MMGKTNGNKSLDLVIEKIKKQTKDPNAIMRLGDAKKLKSEDNTIN